MVVAARPLRRRGRRASGSASPTSSCRRSSGIARPRRDGDRLVHDDVPGNVAAHHGAGGRRRRGRASPRRRTVVELDLDIERSASMPMEGKGVLRPLGRRRRLAARATPRPRPRPACARRVAAKLGLPLDQVEVIAPDVGGGFGVKIVHPWPEEVLVPWAAIRLGREVKWIEDRREHFVAAPTSAASCSRSRSGFDDEGRLLGAGRAVLARQRRLHAVRDHRADHHVDPAARAVQAGRVPGGVPPASTPTR